MKQLNTTEDALTRLFGQLPEESPSDDFRLSMMRKIQAEAVRMKKRNERLTFLSIVLASFVMIALGGLALFMVGVSSFTITFPKMLSGSTAHSVIYLGVISALLLCGDYYMRRSYKKRH